VNFLPRQYSRVLIVDGKKIYTIVWHHRGPLINRFFEDVELFLDDVFVRVANKLHCFGWRTTSTYFLFDEQV